jgi:hypothetical protein
MLSRRDARKMKVVPVKLRQGDLTIPVEFGDPSNSERCNICGCGNIGTRGRWSIPLFDPSMSDGQYHLASVRVLTARWAHLYCAARGRGVPRARVSPSFVRCAEDHIGRYHVRSDPDRRQAVQGRQG